MSYINQLIKRSNLTQREIAKGIGVTEQHFCANIKGNYERLSVSKVSMLADMLEMERRELCEIIMAEYKSKKQK